MSESSKSSNYFSAFAKKYKVIIIILIVIPIILGVACYFSVPFFNEVDSPAWLSFWGGYLGSTIMAAVTLHVLERQLKQNQEENTHNRDNNIAENASNRQQSEKHRVQEIELKWFEDLKHTCSILYSAFNSNDVVIVSDMELLSVGFHDRVVQLLSRMNEAFFQFYLTVNYHNNIVNGNAIGKIQQYAKEYLSLLADMDSLHVYGLLLQDGLANIDLTKEEFDAKYKGFILRHKQKMEIPEISKDRVWDVLIDDRFDKIEYLPEVLNVLRKRIDNFQMTDVGNAISELIKSEYKRIKEYNVTK